MGSHSGGWARRTTPGAGASPPLGRRRLPTTGEPTMADESLRVLAEQLQEACLRLGLTVATAESCTGGLVASAITDVSGSSGYFRGGVVSYSNDAKIALLGVPQALLEAHGAVSAQVA